MASRLLSLGILTTSLALALAGCATEGTDAESTGEEALTLGTLPWDAAAERGFSEWVGRIGTARASGRCRTLNGCIDDAAINPLRAPADAALDLYADCADVPMQLRAYYAVKKNLAFRYASAIAGDGADLRYSKNNRPTAFGNVSSSSTTQRLMSRIAGVVHSGFYRLAPEIADGDTYPIDPTRASLRPGTVYYDPNGHVLVVYQVDEDGTVRTIDGHPDNSLTFGAMAEGQYAVGGRASGGGFRNFRPQRLVSGKVEALGNAELTDFGDTQYGHGDGYMAWIRGRVGNGVGPTPDRLMSDQLDQVCIALQDRVRAVAAGSGMATGPLGPIPPNIYGAEGDWEAFSTPSRDARLRAAFRGVARLVRSSVAAEVAAGRSTTALVQALGHAWQSHQASPSCRVTYANGAGNPVTLTLEDVQARIYDLSFDPYHCPEMRWGAHPRAGTELATCTNDDAAHLARFDAERRNRNVIDREPVASTGPDYGPDAPEDIDVPAALTRLGWSR